MKILNILLMTSLLSVVAVPVAFATCTNCAQKVTADEFVQQSQTHQTEEFVQGCSGFDPRCGG